MITQTVKEMTYTLKPGQVWNEVKVLHIAFGCGCVCSFDVDVEPRLIPTKCEEHGDGVLSTTQEHRLPRAS